MTRHPHPSERGGTAGAGLTTDASSVTTCQRNAERAPDKVNVHGGTGAPDHPIGASGARILVTLIAALDKYELKRGVAGLCVGGGEATAMAVERVRLT